MKIGDNLANLAVGDSPLFAALNRGESSLGSLMQKLAYTDDDPVIFLNKSLKLHDYEVSRSKTFLGRISALFRRVNDPDWIEIDGSRLIQLSQLADTEPPVKLSAAGIYSAEVDGLRTMLRMVGY